MSSSVSFLNLPKDIQRLMTQRFFSNLELFLLRCCCCSLRKLVTECLDYRSFHHRLLLVVIQNDYQNIFKWLMEKQKAKIRDTPVLWSAAVNLPSPVIFREMIDRTASWTLADEYLKIAARKGHLDVLQTLRPRVNITSSLLLGLIDAAAENNRENVVRYLLDFFPNTLEYLFQAGTSMN